MAARSCRPTWLTMNVLGYTYAGTGAIEFQVGDQRQRVDLRGRLNANNGAVLAEVAAMRSISARAFYCMLTWAPLGGC